MSQLALMPEVAPTYDEDLAQWFTPPKLAHKIAQEFLRPLAPMVLEPTAGSGMLALAAHDAGCRVAAVERDPRWAQYLRDNIAASTSRFEVIEADYLELKVADYGPTILMNPPDASRSGIDVVDFLEKALFDAGEGGTVIALIRANCLTGSARYERVWRHALVRDIRYLTRRPSFSGAASGGQQEWCVVRYGLQWLGDNKPSEPVLKWWTEAWT